MRRLPVLLTLMAALGATGCDRSQTVKPRHGVVDLTVHNFRYDHQTIQVRRGTITFNVTNDGPEPTNFRIRKHKRDLASIATLQNGDYGTTTVRLRPGKYVMYSSVGRHEELGEYGKLTVTRR